MLEGLVIWKGKDCLGCMVGEERGLKFMVGRVWVHMCVCVCVCVCVCEDGVVSCVCVSGVRFVCMMKRKGWTVGL